MLADQTLTAHAFTAGDSPIPGNSLLIMQASHWVPRNFDRGGDMLSGVTLSRAHLAPFGCGGQILGLDHFRGRSDRVHYNSWADPSTYGYGPLLQTGNIQLSGD